MAAVMLTSDPAGAFCRATTKCPEGTCQNTCPTTGSPLYRDGGKIEIWSSAEGSPLRGISGREAAAAVQTAFSAWEAAACPDFDGDPPGIRFEFRGRMRGAQADYDPALGSKNINVITFVDQAWPHENFVVALTTVSVSPSTGRIIDTDTEVNTTDYPDIGVDNMSPDAGMLTAHHVDLLGVLTHEAGHHFGLDHTVATGATMVSAFRDYEYDELRSLEPDDVAGICAIYPSVFADDVGGGGLGCGTAHVRGTGSSGLLVMIGVVITIFVRRRRRLG